MLHTSVISFLQGGVNVMTSDSRIGVSVVTSVPLGCKCYDISATGCVNAIISVPQNSVL